MSKAKRVRWWRRIEFLAYSGGGLRCEVVPFSRLHFNWYVYFEGRPGYAERGSAKTLAAAKRAALKAARKLEGGK